MDHVFHEHTSLQMPKSLGPVESLPKQPFQYGDKMQRVQIDPERGGWARLWNLTRQFDKDRVEGVKEDIDALLVFVSYPDIDCNRILTAKQAGLFSAVVTTFTVESYKGLQGQPEDMAVQVLLRISEQLTSYTISGTFANSTITESEFTPFVASKPTILINTLWSLSLVLALMTASLGILVKQWLDDYLAIGIPAPRARLRLRHFREPQIRGWKVYEIAACLPLLLHISLGLFFVGLC